MTNCDDLGPELWALVYHLFDKYKDNPAVAVRELGLRTHHDVGHNTSGVVPSSPQDLIGSTWYADMCAAFTKVKDVVREEHTADVAEARDLVLSLYPDGCNVSEYADAVRTSAAVLPCTVPSDMIDFFISKRGAAFAEQSMHVVTADTLVADVIEGLMFCVLIPRQWWRSRFHSVAKVRRVGLKGSPPTLLIEYERPAGVCRVRRIPLGAHLREHTPTAQLARRLSATHAALLSEAQLQSLLIRCQRLMAQSPTPAQSAPPPTSTAAASGAAAQHRSTPPPPPPLPPAPSSSSEMLRSAAPQKADLGLLYRDPDAALQNVDLNDADDVTLREFKEVMNEKFKENAIKPGDPGYVYDKRVVVAKPVQSSDWDDDSD